MFAHAREQEAVSIKNVRSPASAHAAMSMSDARQDMTKLYRACAHKTRLRANGSHWPTVYHGL